MCFFKKKKAKAEEPKKVEEAKAEKKVEEPKKVEKVEEPKKEEPVKVEEPKKEAAPKKAAPKAEEKKPEPVEEEPAEEKKPIEYRNYHVVKRASDNKWEVKYAGGSKAIKLFDTQKEAIEYTKVMAERQGGHMLVHNSKGAAKGRIKSK